MSEQVPLEIDDALWERVFLVAPLALVATREPDGSADVAPKHRVVALPRHFGFVCRPAHATWRNALREGAFTVGFPGPRQVVMASAAASPRCEDGEKKALRGLPMRPAKHVDGVLVEGCRLSLECRVERTIADLGEEGLVIGRIVGACAERSALRSQAVPDGQLVHAEPLLAYLHPSQFALVDHSAGFPFPKSFHRG